MLLLDTTFYLLHLHLHVVDIIIIIIRAWYYLFHIQEGAGGRRVFLVFCVVLLLVLWCWNVSNDTTTFSLHGREAEVRFYHSHSRRNPTPPQVSPGEKRTQGKTNRCNLTWKPSQDSPRLAQPSPPPPSPSGIDTTRRQRRPTYIQQLACVIERLGALAWTDGWMGGIASSTSTTGHV